MTVPAESSLPAISAMETLFFKCRFCNSGIVRPTDQKATAMGKTVCYAYIASKRKGRAMPDGVAWEMHCGW